MTGLLHIKSWTRRETRAYDWFTTYKILNKKRDKEIWLASTARFARGALSSSIWAPLASLAVLLRKLPRAPLASLAVLSLTFLSSVIFWPFTLTAFWSNSIAVVLPVCELQLCLPQESLQCDGTNASYVVHLLLSRPDKLHPAAEE